MDALKLFNRAWNAVTAVLRRSLSSQCRLVLHHRGYMQSLVDDRDSRISWRGTWTLNGSHEEYKSTTHGTTEDGASFTFGFSGASVFLYGTNPHTERQNRTVTCTVDNEATVQSLLPYTPYNQYRMTVCEFRTLKLADHVLAFHVGFPESHGSLYIDFLAYDNGVSDSSPTQSIPSVSTLAPEHPPTISLPIPPKVSSSSTPQQSPALPQVVQKNKNPIFIAGIVLAMYLTAFLIVGGVLGRQYRRRQAYIRTHVQPFRLSLLDTRDVSEPSPNVTCRVKHLPPPRPSLPTMQRSVSSDPTEHGSSESLSHQLKPEGARPALKPFASIDAGCSVN